MTEYRKYRKKPVEIEAMRFTPEDAASCTAWCGGRLRTEAKASDPSDVAYWLDIPTLEGVMTANVGDWLIRGIQGEFYPCKPDIFEATYEPDLAAACNAPNCRKKPGHMGAHE